MTSLQKAILSTIIYYDALDYPLTFFEIFKYLINPSHITNSDINIEKGFKNSSKRKINTITLIDIMKNLDSRRLRQFISEKDGFYFLKDRDGIIRTRIDRHKIADQKWKKAKGIIYWLQVIPFLRAVIVSGSLALNNTQEESDFDLFVIIRGGRIWLTRFLITGLVQLMGKRRYRNFTKDRICLNHYITDKSMEIKFQSLYNAQTYAHMIPVLETESGVYRRFQKTNDWAKDYLMFWPASDLDLPDKLKCSKFIKTNILLKIIAKAGEACLRSGIGDSLEGLAKKIQGPLIKKNPLTYKKGGRVAVDDAQLEFHPNSPERKVLDRYNRSVIQLGVEGLKKERDSGLL